MISYIPSVTPTNSLEHTSLISTNAVSIHGLSSSVGKIVTSPNYTVMTPISSLSLTTFEHYANLVNTSSNSTRRHPFTSRRSRSTLSINSVHISSVIKKHPVHRLFTMRPLHALAYDPLGLLHPQDIQPFLQGRPVNSRRGWDIGHDPSKVYPTDGTELQSFARRRTQTLHVVNLSPHSDI